MTGPEHQEHAAFLLGLVREIRISKFDKIDFYESNGKCQVFCEGDIPQLVAEAQAHATLAQTAMLATLFGDVDQAGWKQALGGAAA